jgi:hypothetical protein
MSEAAQAELHKAKAAHEIVSTHKEMQQTDVDRRRFMSDMLNEPPTVTSHVGAAVRPSRHGHHHGLTIASRRICRTGRCRSHINHRRIAIRKDSSGQATSSFRRISRLVSSGCVR